MKIAAIVLLVCFFQAEGLSQERNWKVQKTKDGVTVKSEIVSAKNDKGEDIKIMHYIAEQKGTLTLEQAEKYLRDSDNYKDIWESTLETKEIRKVSEDQWISYFLFSSIWPMPKSDCIQQFTVLKRDENQLIIEAKAIQDNSVKTDVKRLTIFDVVYDFKVLEKNVIKLTLTVKTSPAINAPKVLFRSWFPKGPAGIVNRIFEHATNEK